MAIFLKKPWERDLAPLPAVGLTLAFLALNPIVAPLLARLLKSLNDRMIAGAMLQLTLVGVALIWRSNGEPLDLGFHKFGLKTAGFAALGGVALSLVTTAVTWLWVGLLHRVGVSCPPQQALMLVITQANPARLALIAVVVGAAAPLCEEIVFRRMFYGLLLPSAGAILAAAATALLFASLHGFLAGFPGLFLLGVSFQLAFAATGNLWSPVIMHSASNLTSMAAAIWLSNF